MDALRKTLVLSVIAAMLLCVVPVTVSEESDAAGEMDGLMLYEVYPYDPVKGVALYNYGTTSVDLRDYIVADQPSITSRSEGWLSFTSSITIQPGTYVVIADSVSDTATFTGRGNAHAVGEDGIKKNASFNLSSTGDDVYLMDTSGHIIDAMCYGNKTIEDTSLWVGEPATRSSNTIMQREGTVDTDSAEDWSLYVPGRTDLDFDPTIQYDATVTPFLFPDSGGIPIYQALESATESVYINIFLLGNRNIFALLCDLAESGVTVNLLLEGEPTSIGDVDSQANYIQALIEAGGEVRLIGVGDNGHRDRYDVDHAKYAIIDMDTVVITSENWTNDNTNGSLTTYVYETSSKGNRGWGAVIESEEYAQYMYGVFSSDYSTEYGDTKDFHDLSRYDGAVAATLTYQEPDDATFQSYQAKVTPMLSPDSSFDGTRYYIESATERVYSQQQSLGSDLQRDDADSPLNWMKDKASAGVEAKLMISTNVTDCDDVAETINSSSLVQAAVLERPYLHNKGLVCDDVSIVSSVNWTSNSFNNNRESAVAIHSAEIADFFANAFLADFYQYYSYGGYRIDMSAIQSSYSAGEEVALTLQVSPNYTGLTFEWDFGDGSQTVTSDIPRIAHVFELQGSESASTHILTVTLRDADGQIVGSAQKSYTVLEAEQSGGLGDITETFSEHSYVIIPIIVVILGIIAAALRSAGKKKRKSTKKKR